MAKKKTLLIVLVSILILSVTLAIVPLFMNNNTVNVNAATTYNLKAKGEDVNAIYCSHWSQGQGNRSYGETSGKWYFGSGDLTDATDTTKGTYSFTQSSVQSNGLHDDDAIALYYCKRVCTKVYNDRKQSSSFVWEAEDYGTVKFTGLFSKTNSDPTKLCQTQNGVSIDLGNLSDFYTSKNDSGEYEYAWHEGASYTITMWKVASYGTVTQMCQYEKNYTSEYVHLIPQTEFTVYPGDKFVFTLKCDKETGDWSTGTLALLDATFTKKVDQNALNKTTITASKKITSFYALSDTHMSGADAKYLPTILSDMANVDRDASAILNLGDLTDIGVSIESASGVDQMTPFYNQLKNNYLTNSAGQKVPYLNILGNHDVRGNIGYKQDGISHTQVHENYDVALAKYLELEGVSTRNWVKTVGGIRIIGLNTCEYQWDDTTLSADDLQWLDAQLAEGEDGSGKPQFVMIHASDDSNQVKSQGNVTFRQVIEKHPSAIVMSGHTHDAFGWAKVSQTACGSYFINMPGVNWNLAASTYWNATEGMAWGNAGNSPTLQYYYIEVYEKGIIFRARECNTGTWMTDGDVAILANVDTEDYNNTKSESMVAWYKFATVETAHVDAMNNYNLTNLNNGTLATDGIILPTNAIDDPLVYANSATQHPFTYFTAGQKWTISTLYYTGSYNNDWDRILANGDSWSGYFSLQHTPNNFRVVLSTGEEIVFPVTEHSWVRLITWYDGANVNATLYDITNGKNLTASGNSYVSASNYDLNTGIGGFTIGNKGNYTGTGGNGAATEVSDRKIADLRIYSGQISNDEVARIHRGDLGYRSEANLQFSYRPFTEGRVSTDVTGYNSLTSTGASFDEDTASAVFDQGAYPLVNNNPYYNAKTGANVSNDFSDYMRKSKFSVSFRAYLVPAYIDGSNFTYYLFTTGKYSHSFTVAADGNGLLIYLGRGVQGGEGGETAVYLYFENILAANPSGQWIRGTVIYDGTTFTGTCYNEYNKTSYTPVLKDANNNVIANNNVFAGAFGGYGYTVAFGGQTSNGVSGIAQTVFNATGSGRRNVKIGRFDVYSGVLSNSQIAELKTLDDKIAGEYKSETDTLEKVAHYQFNNSDNLGLDGVNGNNLTNKGITVDSVNGGIILNGTSNGTANYLYAPNVLNDKGVDIFDKFRGSMSVSFRAKIKSVGDTPYVILGSGINGKGMYIAVKGNGIQVQSGASVLTFSDIFTSSLEWYRINVVFNYTTQTVSVTAVRQMGDTLINKGTQTRTMTDVGFGGSFYQTFTIGGVADNVGSKLVMGATDDAYNITLTDLRVYSGVLTSTEIANINDYDAPNVKFDATNSKVNASLSDDLSFNYWVKANGGSNVKFNISYNGYTYSNLVATNKEFSQGSGYYWTVSLNGMAPQDMNDKMTIESITYNYQGKEYSFDVSGWTWKNASMQDYLMAVLNDYSQDTKEGKLAILALNYGAEAQKVTNHDTANLANSLLTQTQKEFIVWDNALIRDGGAIKQSAIRESVAAEGNGSLNIVTEIAIAPRYDNKLGWGVYVTLADGSTDFTVQLTDASGALLKEVSKANAKLVSGTTYLVEIDGVVNVSNLEQEFRFKVFAGGEQQYYTYRYNFMSVIMNSYAQSNLVKYVYGLYATAKA